MKHKLQPPVRRPQVPRLPAVRENSAIVSAVSARAHAAGITVSEALRQIATAYVLAPFPLAHVGSSRTGENDAKWMPVRVAPEVSKAIISAARNARISQGEAMRQIVRRWLGRV